MNSPVQAFAGGQVARQACMRPKPKRDIYLPSGLYLTIVEDGVFMNYPKRNCSILIVLPLVLLQHNLNYNLNGFTMWHCRVAKCGQVHAFQCTFKR
jgi:hypothetical protein